MVTTVLEPIANAPQPIRTGRSSPFWATVSPSCHVNLSQLSLC